jgi:hypothetical protein
VRSVERGRSKTVRVAIVHVVIVHVVIGQVAHRGTVDGDKRQRMAAEDGTEIPLCCEYTAGGNISGKGHHEGPIALDCERNSFVTARFPGNVPEYTVFDLSAGVPQLGIAVQRVLAIFWASRGSVCSAIRSLARQFETWLVETLLGVQRSTA